MNWTEWSIAQVALVFSAAALAISAASLFWSIRSKFLHPKPKLSVRLIVNTGAWVEMGVAHIGELEIVNLGPTDCVVVSIVYSTSPKRHFSNKKSWWSVTGSSHSPTGGRAISNEKAWPRLLKAGELCSTIIPIQNKLPDDRPVYGMGVIDAFERTHLISAKEFKKLETARAKLV